jgi:O-antigen/teichoic acid export membrane protein
MERVGVRGLDRLFLSESLSLTSSFAILAGSTFIFWVLSARTLAVDATGNAMVLISLSGLVAIVSKLGLDVTAIRYFDEEPNKPAFIRRALLVSSSVAIIFGGVAYLLLLALVESIRPVACDFAVFVLFLGTSLSLNAYNIVRSILIAIAQSRIVALSGVAMGLGRVLLVIPLAFFGLPGVLLAFLLGMVISLFVSVRSIISVMEGTHSGETDSPRPRPSLHIPYSLSNYLAQTIEAIPALTLPTVILAIGSSVDAAFYYTAFMIYSLLIAVVNSVGSVMLSEGSRRRAMPGTLIRKGLLHVMVILLPCLVLVLALREPLLLFFGAGYAEASGDVLVLMGVSSIPFTVNVIYASMKRLMCDITPLLVLYSLSTAATVVVSVALFPGFGIVSTGLAWICGQMIVIPISIRGIIEYSGGSRCE